MPNNIVRTTAKGTKVTAAMQFKIDGLGELSKIAQNMATANIKDRLTESLVEAAFIAEGKIKRAITDYKAIDTGFMRGSTRINEMSDTQAEIGPNAEYSVYVHGGTSFMQARPFIDLGVKLMEKDLDKIMDRTGQKLAVHIAK